MPWERTVFDEYCYSIGRSSIVKTARQQVTEASEEIVQRINSIN